MHFSLYLDWGIVSPCSARNHKLDQIWKFYRLPPYPIERSPENLAYFKKICRAFFHAKVVADSLSLLC